MSKGMDSKKQTKKEPVRTMKEKRTMRVREDFSLI